MAWKLKTWYKRYNRKYFRGKLPPISLRFAKTEKAVFGYTNFRGNKPIAIIISQRIRYWDRLVKQVLLHEMCHVGLSPRIEHGPKFEAEMRRLARAGAFRGLW
jgi:predicted metal-dependent hydrolase